MKLRNDFPDNIENIIFDFGGVIMDINISKTLTAFSDLQIKGLNKDDVISAHKKFLLDLELGLITPQEFLETLRHEYPDMGNVSDKKVWEAWNTQLQAYDPRRIDLLENLKQRYNLFLLSNTNLPHRIRFIEIYEEQFGKKFEELFSREYYSDEMHLRKPDLNIYRQVIDELNIDPQKTLFIDDNELNITYARQVGLNAYHLTNGEKITDLFV